MSAYKTSRIVASAVSVLGWAIAAIGMFFGVFRLLRGQEPSIATFIPFLVLAAAGFSLVLLGSVARAVFDIADRS